MADLYQPFRLINEQVKQRAIDFIRSIPINDDYPVVIAFKADSRTLQQNSKFHAMLGDFSKQGQYCGRTLDLYGWKNLLVSGHTIATKRPYELIQGIEGELVNIRESTAKMGVSRMNSLIEYSTAYGVGIGVRFSDKVNYQGW